MAVDWGYYEKFDRVMKEYLPDMGDDETEFTGAVRLTKAEIERTMKEMDGKNHSVIWEGETE